MTSTYIMILVTTKNSEEAKRIADALLKERLIACANIINAVDSVFIWQGKRDHAKESLLILKTKKSFFKKVAHKVKLLHSYQTPEIIAMPIMLGEEKYLQWINDSLAGSKEITC